jgi:hypothetical protein
MRCRKWEVTLSACLHAGFVRSSTRPIRSNTATDWPDTGRGGWLRQKDDTSTGHAAPQAAILNRRAGDGFEDSWKCQTSSQLRNLDVQYARRYLLLHLLILVLHFRSAPHSELRVGSMFGLNRTGREAKRT